MKKYIIIILSIVLQQVILEDQEKKFWEVYEEYLKGRHVIKKQHRKRRYKHADMDEAEAQEMLNNLMVQKRQEMDLQLSLYEDLSEFLDAKQILHLDYKERRFREKVVEKLRKGRKKRHG